MLERMRNTHEELEAMERAGSELLMAKSRKNLSASIDHCLDYLCAEMISKVDELQSLYLDCDSQRADEISQSGGEGSMDVWHSFYANIKETKEYNRRHEDKQSVCSLYIQNFTYPIQDIKTGETNHWISGSISHATTNSAAFSGEEVGGKYIDMSKFPMGQTLQKP